MLTVLKRFSNNRVLVIAATVVVAFVLAFVSSSALRSNVAAAPVSNVVIEETLAETTPVPAKPGNPQPLGWTAWSG